MYVGAKKPHDRVEVKGSPEISLLFEHGVAGDEATVAMLIAMVPAVLSIAPGVRTMAEAPVPHYRAGQ